VSFGAGDRSDRVVSATETRGDRLVVSIARDALPACLLSRAQNVLRTVVLERREVAAPTHSIVSQLSFVQIGTGCMARALSSAAMLALLVWSSVGVSECAT